MPRLPKIHCVRCHERHGGFVARDDGLWCFGCAGFHEAGYLALLKRLVADYSAVMDEPVKVAIEAALAARG